MDDDFNTPEALAILFELSHEINKMRLEDLSKAAQLGGELRRLGGVLGLLQADPEAYLQGTDQESEEIERLIGERQAARKRRDWARADQIRAQLKEQGIVLEDGAEGTIWRRE
ncbi:Cysteinyl-tRNA synthetase, class Ia, DALR domain protein [Candidatus Thiomargarita nelsonii]|uniref:Cysteine--tRNA ligase n=1 Tax=Candidatus Thiomargarita nelsonii TaxID=1003181 RepID=A0A176RWX6_9GAMM|nr:Cysteinyl-tRNA synthetase, class Ia, DALR domain protein [Candidatus Thiomargarita nelsonii]